MASKPSKFGSVGKLSGAAESAMKEVYSPDLHAKMSKKIAQLTKVIYHLNTKNDEHDGDVRALRETHEQEILNVMRDAEQKIIRFQQRLNDGYDPLEGSEAAKLFIQSRETSIAEFIAFKEQVVERERSLRSEHEDIVEMMRCEINELNSQFSERIAQFTEVTKIMEKAHKFDIKELTESRESQVAEITQSYEERLSNIQAKHLDIEESLRAQISTANSRLMNIEGSSNAALQELQQKEAKWREEEIRRWTKATETLETEITVQKVAHQNEIEQMRVKLNDAEQTNAALTEDNSYFEGMIHRHEEKDEDLQQRLADLTTKLDSANQTIIEKIAHTEDFEMLLRKSEIRNAELSDEKIKQEFVIKERDERIETLTDDINCFRAKTKRLEDENARILDTAERVGNDKDAVSSAMEEERVKWERKVASMKEHQEEEICRERIRITEEAANEIEKSRLDAESIRDATQAKCERVLAEAEEQHRCDRLLWEEETKRRLNDLGADSELRIAELETTKANLTEEASELQAQISRLQILVGEREALLGVSAERERQLGEQDSIIQGMRETLAEKDERIASTEEKLFEIRETLKATRKEVDEGLTNIVDTKRKMENDLKKQLAAQKKTLDTTWQGKLDTAVADVKMQIRKTSLLEQRGILEEERADMRRRMEEVKAGLEQEVKEIRAQADTEKEKHLEEVQNLISKFEDSRIEHKEMVMFYTNESQKQKDIHTAAIAALTNTAEQRERTAIKRLEDAFAVERDEVAERAAFALKERNDEHNNHINEINRENMKKSAVERASEEQKRLAENKKLEEEHAAAMGALRERLKKELEELRTSQRRYNDVTMTRINELNDTVRSKDALAVQLRSEIKSAKDGLLALRQDIELKENEIAEVKQDALERIKSATITLKDTHADEISELSVAHELALQNIRMDFDKSQGAWETKLGIVEHKLRMAESRYEARESRTEDLEKIHELELQCMELNTTLKQKEEEKRSYEKELLNREQNYNKLFCNQPNVGIIDPFASKRAKEAKIIQAQKRRGGGLAIKFPAI